MWTTARAASTEVEPAAVPAALAALHSGVLLGPEPDSFDLDGPFAVGTSVSVTPRGQDPMTSVIVELVPGERYADRAVLDGLEPTFRHALNRQENGRTAVAHTLEIDGPGADEVGPELGPRIGADFPVAMAELLGAAERGVHA